MSAETDPTAPVKLRAKSSASENVRPTGGILQIEPEDSGQLSNQVSDLSQYLHNRSDTLELPPGEQPKSDSLNSAQAQACCSKLAFNIYNKALESAKKALPKNKPKSRPHSGAFPRSFGEDFHSLGPEGFYYLDDSQTECSNDYRDIEFNRDSYMLPGGDTMPELSEEEFYRAKPRLAGDQQPDSTKPEPEPGTSWQLDVAAPRMPENTPLGSVENLPRETTAAKRKAPSLLERLFKKSDKSKRNKARSEPRELVAKSSFRAQSLPPAPPMQITEDGKLWFPHRALPPPNDPETVVVSNVSRQQPVKLVYARPPEIIVQEVTNLAGAVDTLPHLETTPEAPQPPPPAKSSPAIELAEKTMLEILDEAIKQLQEESPTPAASQPQGAKRKRSLRIGKPKFLQKLELARPKRAVGEDAGATDRPRSPSSGKTSPKAFFHGKRFLKPKFRKMKADDDSKLPSMKGPSGKKMFSVSNRRPMLRRQLSTETETGSLYKKTKQASNEHLYEGVSDQKRDVPDAIEIPVGVPLDAPYTEEEPTESVSSAFHRYPVPVDQPEPSKMEAAVPVTVSEKPPVVGDNYIDLKMPKLANSAIQVPELMSETEEAPIWTKPARFPAVRHPESPLPPEPVPEPQMKQAEMIYHVPEPEPEPVPIKEIGVTYQPPDLEPVPDGESSYKKNQLRNMVGSFGQSFRTKMKGVKDLVHQQVNKRPLQRSLSTRAQTEPKVVDYTLKPAPEEWQATDQCRVDATIDDEDHYEVEKPRKKVPRKFKLPAMSTFLTEPDEPEKTSFGNKNRERLQQIRSRAQESFNQFTDKIRQQKKALQAKAKSPERPARPPAPRFEPYQYDIHFGSDSELSPGTGVDSLRRSKVFQELAETQERLEMYMSPVDRHEPRRPPRRKGSSCDGAPDALGSMPSLAASSAARRALPKLPPPRPPPPRLTTSVPSVISCESEIPLGNSMSDVYGDGAKRKRFPRKQRVPPELFYQNVRLSYRPKKSYVELLKKSQPFQSTVSVQKATIERSQSTGQLYGRYRRQAPARPLRQAAARAKVSGAGGKPPLSLGHSSRATSITSSRTPYATDPDEPHETSVDMALFERFERREAPRLLGQDCGCDAGACRGNTLPPDLSWEPFTWKVKRCRSYTELEVRQRLKKQCAETNLDEVVDSTDTLVETTGSEGTLRNPAESSVPRRVLRWLSSASPALRRAESARQQPPELPRKTPPARPPLPPQRKRPVSPTNLFELNYTPFPSDDTYYHIDNNGPSLPFVSGAAGTPHETGTNGKRRPLPPPPVPPRPRLIPAHYGSHPRPITRDVACDTSENGFATASTSSFLLRNEPKLVNGAGDSLPRPDAFGDEDEITLMECRRADGGDASLTSNTASPSAYMDAHSQAQSASKPADPGPQWSSDDDETINDDVSSLSSSNYQSLAGSGPNDSFVHRAQFDLASTGTDDDFQTPQQGSTTVSDNDYDRFNQQFHSSAAIGGGTGPDDKSSGENSPSSTLKHGNANRQSYISASSSSSSVSASSTYSCSSESNKSLVIQVNQSETTSLAEAPGPSQIGRSHSDGDAEKKQKRCEKRASSPGTLDSTSCEPGPVISGVQPDNNPALRENLSSLPKATPKGAKPDKRYYCAHEFFTTERDYVDVLLMLVKEFRNHIRPYVSAQWLDTFFRPLNVVTPVNQRLLAELQTRILVEWDDNPRISDIIIQICPYFKEYSIYIREFDRLKSMLENARTEFVEFESRLLEFEASARCRKLPIKFYLLRPIQRLPQYRLMLLQYLKCLDPHDPEREDTEKALKVVTEVVDHMERESLMAEQSRTLNEVRAQVITNRPTRIVVPGRVLIRRGQLDKVSRKEVHVRYFILFNDVLFYLAPVVNGMYKLKEELPLLGMQVELTDNFPNEFVVRSVKRSFALLTKDPQERDEWVRDLRKAIADHTEKQQSFKQRRDSSNALDAAAELADGASMPQMPSPQPLSATTDQVSLRSRSEAESRLGDLAPVWLHDSRVSMCHLCAASFTLLNRRHHCRACGQIFCAQCSSHQIRLKYLNNKPDRVCDDCYRILSSRQRQASETAEAEPDYANLDEMVPRITVSGASTPKRVTSCAVPPITSLSVARKLRSNSCHELRNDQVAGNRPGEGSLALARNNNVRLSSRLRQKNLSSVLVEVSAKDPTATISGYLQQFRVPKKCWKRYWFVIKSLVLYTFKASDDVHASESLPLPGYQVSMAQESIKGYPAANIVKLTHPGQSDLYFFAETKEDAERWFKCLKEASLGQTAPKTTTAAAAVATKEPSDQHPTN